MTAAELVIAAALCAMGAVGVARCWWDGSLRRLDGDGDLESLRRHERQRRAMRRCVRR